MHTKKVKQKKHLQQICRKKNDLNVRDFKFKKQKLARNHKSQLNSTRKAQPNAYEKFK